MSYTTPLTAVANAILTAAQWNLSMRDNMLETPAAKATTAGRWFIATGANAIAERAIETAVVSANQGTLSTSYADLTTVGPAVTVTTGTRAIVIVSSQISNDTVGARSFASFGTTGATTNGADDGNAIGMDESASGRLIACSRVTLMTGLTAGSNTFTMKYRSGNGAATASFAARSIVAMAL